MHQLFLSVDNEGALREAGPFKKLGGLYCDAFVGNMKKDLTEDKILAYQVLVCQHGARRRYAVPALLERAGALVALYTDSCIYSPLGKIATCLYRFGIRSRGVTALASRVPKSIDRRKIVSLDRSAYMRAVGRSGSLSPRFKSLGLRQADVVYSMYGEELDFLQWAKEQGARIVVDVFVHPRTNRIVAEEKRRVLGSANLSNIEREDAHSMRAFEVADLLLCPSEWVAEGVRRFAPEHADKIRIVPYGSSLKVNASINEAPRPGRIFFVGREPLRKGLHHLAEAAHLVRQSGLYVEVHAAGVDEHMVSWMEYKSEIRCLGKVPMDQMRREYEQADVFVLPSLSEGQAGVILEAMACGCPIIATRESGVDFEPGCGVTVPVRDPAALAQAIIELVGNRDVRNDLARGALRQAAMFSMDAWQQRLVQVVEDAARP